VLTPARNARRWHMQFDLIVEIPAGSRNKYELDHH
jgi:inorganic pyrophosphatase